MEAVTETFSAVGLDLPDISRLVRLGKPGSGTRPILATMSDPAVQQDILRNVQANKASLPTGVSMRPDLTKFQQDHDKDIRDQVDKANAVPRDLTDESGEYRWRAVGPPGNLRMAKTRNIEEWEAVQARRQRGRADKRKKATDSPTPPQETANLLSPRSRLANPITPPPPRRNSRVRNQNNA